MLYHVYFIYFSVLEKCCENFKKSLRSELPCSHLFHHHLPRTYSCPASLQTSNQFQKTCSLWPSSSFWICVQTQTDALTCVQGFFLCSFLSALKFGFLRLLASGVYQPTPLFPFLCCVWPGNTQQGSKLGQSQIQTLFSVFQELFSFHCSVSSILKILVS